MGKRAGNVEGSPGNRFLGSEARRNARRVQIDDSNGERPEELRLSSIGPRRSLARGWVRWRRGWGRCSREESRRGARRKEVEGGRNELCSAPFEQRKKKEMRERERERESARGG